MRIRTVLFKNLSTEELASWRAIQRAEPQLASPYFHPQFTAAVAAVRDDIEVAVLADNGRAIGFFPFQRSRWNTGEPVGGGLSDFHGLIAPSTLAVDPLHLLRCCRLKAWRFDHLPSAQRELAAYGWRMAESPFVDLAEGIEAYFARRENDSRLRAEFRRKARLLARDIGPLRYEENADRKLVSTVIEWKSSQFRRSGIPNIFDFAWVHQLLHQILECQEADFSCHLSAAYAGDTVAAVHLGIRSGPVLHLWFPVYNVQLARYSPGFLHSMEMIRSAAAGGVRRIDLGKGPEAYKRRIMSGTVELAEGAVDLRPGVAAFRQAWRTTRDRLRRFPPAAPIRAPVRLARRFRHWVDATMHNMWR
jgi:CelD/BcsL family acetyltransferase involved in cellulose biosynthesis